MTNNSMEKLTEEYERIMYLKGHDNPECFIEICQRIAQWLIDYLNLKNKDMTYPEKYYISAAVCQFRVFHKKEEELLTCPLWVDFCLIQMISAMTALEYDLPSEYNYDIDEFPIDHLITICKGFKV